MQYLQFTSDELLEQGILRLNNSDTKQQNLLINTVTAQIERAFMEPLGCPRLKHGSSLQGREAFIYLHRAGFADDGQWPEPG